MEPYDNGILGGLVCFLDSGIFKEFIEFMRNGVKINVGHGFHRVHLYLYYMVANIVKTEEKYGH
jgi:hypothetical protein